MTVPLQGVAIPTIADLNRNAARLLQQSLASAAQAASPAALTASDLALARSNVKALAYVQAVGLHGAYAYLRDFVSRQAIPIYASAEFLEGWLATYGMVRKPAALAVGNATGTGVSGAGMDPDVLLQTADGRLFRTITMGYVVGGSISVWLTAEAAGAAGNLAAGEALTLVSPVAGIDSGFTIATDMGGGADLESDELAVYRLQQRLANEPMGGCPADYARWALEVPAITRAWGVRNPAGPTSAGVIIMADGNADSGLPTPVQREQVLDYIRDPRRGPPDELFVIVPTAVVLDMTLAIAPNTPALRAAVTAALRDLFFREAVPGGSLPHGHVAEAISTVLGEYNHTVISPALTSGAFFTTSGYAQLLVLGSVNFVA